MAGLVVALVLLAGRDDKQPAATRPDRVAELPNGDPRRPAARRLPVEQAHAVVRELPRKQTRPAPPPDAEQNADTIPATNSPSAALLPGLRRPCSQARDYVVYGFGARLGGRLLLDSEAECGPPVPVVKGVLPLPSRMNLTSVFYGACRPGQAEECQAEVVVTNEPSCESPHWFFHAMTPDPGGPPVAHKHLTVLGVPAVRLGNQMIVYTATTTITIDSDNQRLVRAAAQRLVPMHPATTTVGRLPRPSASVYGSEERRVSCVSTHNEDKR